MCMLGSQELGHLMLSQAVSRGLDWELLSWGTNWCPMVNVYFKVRDYPIELWYRPSGYYYYHYYFNLQYVESLHVIFPDDKGKLCTTCFHNFIFLNLTLLYYKK